MARYSTAAVQDRIDSDRLNWDEYIEAIASEVRDLTVTPSPRLNVVRRRVQGLSVTTVVPRWDAKAGCWTTLAPTSRRKAQERVLGVREAVGSGVAPADAVARLERWRKYREHPLFGSLVGPARAAEGGWIKDVGTFWELVGRETDLIQRDLLAQKWGGRK
jgi:hypothetical protein